MAGALTISVLAFAGCGKKEETSKESTTVSSTSASSESSESNTESSDPSVASSSEETQQDPVDPTEKQALELAAELGMEKEELHDRYDLFIRYADVIVNNPKLGDYRAYALHLFPEVADHLSKENEAYFFEKLKDLQMETMNMVTSSGEFYPMDDKIRVIGDGVVYDCENTYSTIFHELTHFVDAYVDGRNKEDVYYTGTRFAYEEDMTPEEWQNNTGIYASDFITEGGAELYMSKYFSKIPRAYYCEHSFLTGLEWIYGSEKLDRLFYGYDSTMQFIEMLQDAGYTNEQICHVLDCFSYYTYQRREQPENLVHYNDVLIDLYEHVKGPAWKDDMVFVQILSQINNASWYDTEFKHAAAITFPDMWNYTNSLIGQVDQGNNPATLDCLTVVILDGKPYMASSLENRNEINTNTPSVLILDYDFDAAKLNSYEYYQHAYPKVVPQGLPEGKALDDKLASLLRDNSSAHRQTAYSGSSELKDLYERAAQIGNKFGVYINLGENLPSYYIGSREISGTENLNTALDKIENILGRFPDGYFDQLKYGNYSGLEISLLSHPLWEELMVFSTDMGYTMSISLDCDSKKTLDALEEKLLDAIFFATDLRLKAYFENFETPDFSEAVWLTYNSDACYYVGFDTSEFAKSHYEADKDYFVNFTAMRYAPKDRSQLMTCLMQSQDLSDPCTKKAEFYSQCIREAFDDSSWPEQTIWEEELESQKDTSGEKAA